MVVLWLKDFLSFNEIYTECKLLMLCLVVDASNRVAISVPFGSMYHNPKWAVSCKKW